MRLVLVLILVCLATHAASATVSPVPDIPVWNETNKSAFFEEILGLVQQHRAPLEISPDLHPALIVSYALLLIAYSWAIAKMLPHASRRRH